MLKKYSIIFRLFIMLLDGLLTGEIITDRIGVAIDNTSVIPKITK
jgi:hypothetical protein